ncbi:hypothetical protein [Sinorhizobium fredii]|uniref:hypothetical protein n=1 Tax=Rhizobium fredii TaxID=380 RepID=UPI001F0B0C98|nr:hypothetical protein [Sinorhizobium fredii]
MTAKDQLTGFSGIVIGRAQYITGCDQYLLTPRTPDKDAKWFDEQRLVIDPTYAPVELDNSNGPGADLPAPIK